MNRRNLARFVAVLIGIGVSVLVNHHDAWLIGKDLPGDHSGDPLAISAAFFVIVGLWAIGDWITRPRPKPQQRPHIRSLPPTMAPTGRLTQRGNYLEWKED